MTTLKPETFAGEAKFLLPVVRRALTNLAGGAPDQNRVTYHPITGAGKLFWLNPQEDSLRLNYKQVWDQSTLEYDKAQSGAEIYVPGRRMYLGPAMLRFTNPMDLEKIIAHEYLHAALDDDTQRLGYQAEHDQINMIISQSLKYPGPPNPCNPSEGWNQC